MSTTASATDDPSVQLTPPIRPAEVLDAQDRMDDQLLSRDADQNGPRMAPLAARLPHLVPAHPADLTTARQLTDAQLAARVGDATGRLLQLPRSLDRFQESAHQQQRDARHLAQAAATRAQQTREQLERRGWLRRLLTPHATLQLRQQLEAAHQQRTQATQQLRAAQVRLQAICDRQDERTLRLGVDRSHLRDGAAAVLVLAERGLTRDLSDRNLTRQPPGRDPDPERTGHADQERGGGQDRQPAMVRGGPERD